MAATLESIYDRLHGADTYHPYSANTFQDWATEAGDILTISRGDDDYVVPVHSAHLSWHGSPQVVLNGTGNKKRESIEKAAQRKYARGGGAYRTASMLYHEFTDEDGYLHSSLMMSASELRSEFQATNSSIYSVISQTASEIRTEVGNAESGIFSSIQETADQIRSEVNTSNSQVYSVISQTESQIRTEVANVESGLQSSITQTASQIRSEVHSAESGIYSVINQTSCNIMLVVGNKANVFHQYSDPALTETVANKDIWIKDAGLQTHGKAESFTYDQLGSYRFADFYGSEIYVRKNGEWVKVGGDQLAEIGYAELKVEQDRIAIITDGMSGDYADFIVELGRIHSDVEDVQAGLESTIEQTASMIRSAVWTANSEMYSEIIQTQSMIRSEVSNAESGIRSTITQTASGLTIAINRKRAQYVQATDPSLTNTMYNGDIWIVDNNIYTHSAMAALTHATLGTHGLIDFYGKNSFVWKNGEWLPFSDERAQNYDQARLDINDKEIHALWGDITDKYADFLLEKTQIRSIVEDKTNQLGSEIRQTASEIRTSVWAANSQIYSVISQTASAIRTEVTNKTNSISSSITQTAESIRSEVNTANSQIYTAIEQTASQIRLEVTNKTSSLQSLITQAADKISLVVQGTGQNAKIKAAEIVAAINNGTSSILLSADHIKLDANGSMKLGDAFAISLGLLRLKTTMFCDGNVSIEEGHSIGFADESLFLTGSSLATTIKSASVSGSTLTLTTYSGSTINFSKPSPTPSWGTASFVDNTNNLPSGTKHQVNGLKTAIVNNRTKQGYIYFTITIDGTRHVYYFADNGNGWTT